MKSLEISSRFELLDALANWSKPLDDISRYLSGYSWDYDGEPYVLKREHIVKAVERLVSGEVTPQDLEKWANLLECREDIDFEDAYHDRIDQVVYRLANPELEGPVTASVCRQLVSDLTGEGHRKILPFKRE